ncbi:helix-turn-helix domain-containing protein [Actinopolyspora mortivallis]|uniref:helix-turn-helix domain-containing protein n=1 Tax=Actinopolyspora mortivallis TaxID=33906 RepID=UPI0011B21989
MAHGKPLPFDERDIMSRGIAREVSHRCIAAELGRHPSVIPREIARNGGNELLRAPNAFGVGVGASR